MINGKPLPFVVPKLETPIKPAQRREVKRMTLIAGFTGFGGLALCADRQETVGEYSKRSVHKIREVNVGDMTVAFAGSGVAHFVDVVAQEMEWKLEPLKNPDADMVKKTIESVLVSFHEKHLWTRPDHGIGVGVEFLVACVPHGPGHGPLLFHTSETVVNWIEHEHKTIGVGCHLADFLLEHLHSPGGDKWHMYALGQYVLSKVAEYVEGVGKGTDVRVFTYTGNDFGVYAPEDVDALRGIFCQFDDAIKESFCGVTDIRRTGSLNTGDSSSLKQLEDAMEQFKGTRDDFIEIANRYGQLNKEKSA